MKREEWEVVVVGGGSAGIAAGIQASRAGARVLLLERCGFLGGMGTAALVHSICGLYRLRKEPGAKYAHRGFPREFAEAMVESGASPGPARFGKLDVLPHHPPGFALLADRLCLGESNLTVRFHSEVFEVKKEPGGWEIALACRGTIYRVDCRCLVDCSGDAAAASLAGLEVESAPPERLQRPAYIVGLQGFPDAFLGDQGRLQLSHAIVTGIRKDALPRDMTGAHFRETGRPGEMFCTIDLGGGEHYDPVSPASLSDIERHGRFLAHSLVTYLRSSLPELDSLYLSHLPARAGVRESRRIVARHGLTGDEILRGAPMPDGIATVSWPMELREKPTGPRWRFPEEGSSAQIPLRSLRVPEHDDFFVAGRCIGATHEAQAAIRVMGTCLATGAAAGVAAALQARNGSVDADAIREIYTP